MVYIGEMRTYYQHVSQESQISDSIAKLFFHWRNSENHKLDEKSMKILRYFTVNRHGSTYQCAKYMNEDKNTKISYKNVHVRVKNLHRLEMLKISTENPNRIHGAIYYKLSQFGILHLLAGASTLELFIIFIESNYLLEFENFSLYKKILYPYVKIDTLKEIKTYPVQMAILTYIQRCCKDLLNIFQEINSQSVYSIKEIEKLGGIVATSKNGRNFHLKMLRLDESDLRKIDGLTQELNISLNDGEKSSLRFHGTSMEINCKINRNEKHLELYKNGEIRLVIGLSSEQLGGEKITVLFTPIDSKQVINGFVREGYDYQLTGNLIRLLVDILTLKTDNEWLVKDLKLLKKDTNFAKILHGLREFVEAIYSKFENLTS